jgi:hypothetical protein
MQDFFKQTFFFLIENIIISFIQFKNKLIKLNILINFLNSMLNLIFHFQ